MNTQSYIEQATERRWWNPYTWLMAVMAVVVVGLSRLVIALLARFSVGGCQPESEKGGKRECEITFHNLNAVFVINK